MLYAPQVKVFFFCILLRIDFGGGMRPANDEGGRHATTPQATRIYRGDNYYAQSLPWQDKNYVVYLEFLKVYVEVSAQTLNF